jgi:hypothetical protein
MEVAATHKRCVERYTNLSGCWIREWMLLQRQLTIVPTVYKHRCHYAVPLCPEVWDDSLDVKTNAATSVAMDESEIQSPTVSKRARMFPDF